jgi:hypothetical protein
MHDEPHSEANSARGLTMIPWRIVSVRQVSGHLLAVQFADGTTGEVDMSRVLAGSARIFAPLKDPRVFSEVRIEYGALSWSGEIDFAPDAMYDDIRRTGRSIPGEFSSRPTPGIRPTTRERSAPASAKFPNACSIVT